MERLTVQSLFNWSNADLALSPCHESNHSLILISSTFVGRGLFPIIWLRDPGELLALLIIHYRVVERS